MRWLYVDDRGECRDEWTVGSMGALRTRLSDGDARNYLAINLGFAAVCLRGASIVVHVRPAILNEKALAGLMYWLSDQPSCRRIAAALYSDEGWQHRILGIGYDSVRLRLLHLIAAHRLFPDDAILRRVRAPESLPGTCGLRAALSLWSEIGSDPKPNRLDRLLTGPLRSHYVWINWSACADRLLLTAVGEGVPACAKKTLAHMVGMPLDEQPDILYGRYCEDVYRDVAVRGQPLLEDIDALVTWPGYGCVRRTYRRLILPFGTPSGGCRLLGASFEDANIDLRLKAS
ncbi:MAG: hypothetical protein ACREC6_07610 [Hyphomicrobiaceae bacterium]